MTDQRLRSPRLAARPWQRCAAAGFSLTELLIYVALGTLLAAGAAASVIANIRTASNLELRQRAVDTFSRLNLFLHSEVSEGEWIEYEAINLPNECRPGQPLFAIVLPNPLNPPEPPLERLREPMPRIFYFTRNDGADLWRCGPGFDSEGYGTLEIAANGSLIPPIPTRVIGNTRLTITQTDDERTLRYTIELRNRSGTVTLQRGSAAVPLVARTGVHVIE